MKIHLTTHLKERLQLRQIGAALPITVYEQAMVAYVSEGDETRLLTIHPLKPGQKDNRLASGRWRKA